MRASEKMDVSMVFGIIFTVILIIFILGFASGVIPDWIIFMQKAEVLKTINDLKTKVAGIHGLAEGSSIQFTLSFTNEYKLCFFNSSDPSPQFYSDASMTWNPDQTVKFRINQSGYNSWYYRGEDDATGHGYNFAYLDTATEKNFCATGGSKIYLLNKGGTVEIHL